jgi:hypothetical protein
MKSSAVRPLLPALRALMMLGSTLVLIAGIQLFVLSSQTEVYFAWSIQPPLTAAVLGAFYWGTMVLGYLSAFEQTWAKARLALPAVFVFVVLTLAATLLHIDRFHLTAPNPLTRGAAYIWLVVYAGLPVALVILFVLQLRVPGGDPPRKRPLPLWFKIVLGLQAAFALVTGFALFLAPVQMAKDWFWQLTPLTARALGAWWLSVGLLGGQTVWENDWDRIGNAMIAYMVFAVLLVIAMLQFPESLNWSAASAPHWMVLVISMLLTGAYGWFRSRATRA